MKIGKLVVRPKVQFSWPPHDGAGPQNRSLPAGKVGAPYSADFTATGGLPPYSWFVVNNINELPPGLTLDTTSPDFNNVLDGTPTQAGTFSFPIQVQDSQDNTVSGTVTVTINP